MFSFIDGAMNKCSGEKNDWTLNLNPGADCISRAELGVIPNDMHSHNSVFCPKMGEVTLPKI